MSPWSIRGVVPRLIGNGEELPESRAGGTRVSCALLTPSPFEKVYPTAMARARIQAPPEKIFPLINDFRSRQLTRFGGLLSPAIRYPNRFARSEVQAYTTNPAGGTFRNTALPFL